MIQLYPVKAFYKVISNDEKIEEIDYVKADKEGNLYIEKYYKDGTTEQFKLVEEKI